MGKLIRVVVLLVLLVAGVALYVHFTKSAESEQPQPAAAVQTAQQKQDGKGKKEGGMQVQEKYGFAPIGE